MSSDFQTICTKTSFYRNQFLRSRTFEDIRIVRLVRMAPNGRDLQTPVILRYFKEPPASAYPMDLMDGFDTFVYPPDCANDLVRMEKFLMLDGLETGTTTSRVQFCTQRSCLMMIMHRGLGDSIPFTLYATKSNNRIFLVKSGNEFDFATKYPSLKLRINTFADSPEMDPDSDRVAVQSEQTFAIYRAKLMNFDLLYSGEVDGVKSDQPVKDIHDMEELNQCSFVKVRLRVAKAKSGFPKMVKMQQFWLQAYLSKIDGIYIATRDSEQKVHEPLEYTTTRGIQLENNINPSICCGYLSKCLDLIERTMSLVNCPYTTYEFHFCGPRDSTIEYRIHEGKTKLSFLSEEFIEFIAKHN